MSYEKKDVNVGKIVGYTLAAVVILTAIIIFLNEFFIFQVEGIKQERDSVVSTELRELRAAEEETLNSYKALNADKNKYQIPIDRAMKLLADEAYAKQ
ncbi:MAG: hypothetical protein JW956_04995 [Calditrichaceae bacterium]|nr:hypothetical protein [Calditrichaceae bacterium]HES58855.1 hypothetical protein [Caldithrix sp.]